MPNNDGTLTTQEIADIQTWMGNKNPNLICPWDSGAMVVENHIYEAVGYPMTSNAAVGAGVEPLFAMECATCGYHSFHSFDAAIAESVITEFRS